MEYSKLISTARSIEKVIEDIKLNKKSSHQWFSVIGKNKCLYELGGRNHNGHLRLKAYIPLREDGKYVVYENGMINSEYSLVEYGEIEFPTFHTNFSKIKNVETMIKFLKTTDFTTYHPIIVEEQRKIQEYETIYTCKS